jgi:transposase
MDSPTTHDKLPSVPTGTQEELVIKQNQWCVVRTLFEQGLNKTAIARQLELDIKTVRKWIAKPFQPQHRKRPRALDQYAAFLQARAPEVGFNAAVLLREVQALGYQGSYPVVLRYIRPWRLAAQATIAPTLRFETEPGQQAQVDWGSINVCFDAGHKRVHLFIMVLGYSRRIFVKAYLNERLDALLEGHAAAFAHFGGRTRTILYDNPRTIVLDKDESTGAVTWNPTFKDRLDFYGVELRLCRYYRAQTKGKVESGVKYVKRNALVGRTFRDLEHLNEWLLEWSVQIADQRLHGTTHERPAARFARGEAQAMIAVEPRQPPPRERLEQRIVPRDGLIVIDTNRYPVPLEWVGQQAAVRILADQIIITTGKGEPLTHARLQGKFVQARWLGPPRHYARLSASPPEAPPRFALSDEFGLGEVEVRELAAYQQLLEEVGT